jgi:hypothetical protein
MRYLFLFLLFLFFNHTAPAQVKSDALLKKILATQSDSLLEAVLNHPEMYRYQIIYTRIDRDKNNIPSFKNYYYNVNAERYFNPPSVVKMPLAFL